MQVGRLPLSMRRVRDVTAPESRHSVHVTGPDDLVGIAGWSRETLYRAVKFVDDGDVDADADGGPSRTVVLDYGRGNLYAAAASELTYEPPRALGLLAAPALRVAAPDLLDPEGPSTEPFRPVTVSPEFDVLVPAFDWTELDADDLPPPVDYRSSESPSGAGTGTPG